jgi:hypothetical protein
LAATNPGSETGPSGQREPSQPDQQHTLARVRRQVWPRRPRATCYSPKARRAGAEGQRAEGLAYVPVPLLPEGRPVPSEPLVLGYSGKHELDMVKFVVEQPCSAARFSLGCRFRRLRLSTRPRALDHKVGTACDRTADECAEQRSQGRIHDGESLPSRRTPRFLPARSGGAARLMVLEHSGRGRDRARSNSRRAHNRGRARVRLSYSTRKLQREPTSRHRAVIEHPPDKDLHHRCRRRVDTG